MHPDTNTLATKKPKRNKAAVIVLNLAISRWSKRRSSAQIDERKLVGSKKWYGKTQVKTTVRKNVAEFEKVVERFFPTWKPLL